MPDLSALVRFEGTGRPIYFARWGTDHNVDLCEVLVGPSSNAPSLNDLATACGLPGKIFGSGRDVADLWQEGELATIIAYNEIDAVTTYLLALRAALFGGALTSEGYEKEVALVEDLREGGSKGRPHLGTYLAAWRKSRGSA